ncbi:MAG TPA: hypothetical protein VF744_00400 [Beijerinckiaceae bacterium]|jgi:hypothetical protein
MIKNSLRAFVNRALEHKHISTDDVKELRRDTLRDGLVSREEADALIALDRVAVPADGSWAEFLVGSIVEFAVWTSRPTGTIDRETARWLVTTLSGRGGPTATAARIAFEIVREAETVDETLLAFVMRGAKHRGQGKDQGPAVETHERAAA